MTEKTTKTTSTRKVAAKKISANARLDKARARVAEQVERTEDAREEAGEAIGRIKPSWLLTGGVLGGLVVGSLPQRALVATAGALAGLAVRLFNTPLGPMAIGAALARSDRKKRGSGES